MNYAGGERRAMNEEQYYSTSYDQAKERFRHAVSAIGGKLVSYPLDIVGESDLTVDVAILGSATADRTLVVTSGIHGVEGFFGSAVQLAWLEDVIRTSLLSDLRVVLVHAVNPYGFRHLRRVNEDNIDLNRNFPELRNSYSGAPPGYAIHNRFLNPDSMPSKHELFKLKAALKIMRYGMLSLKESIASGQYLHAQGLFFGGVAPAQSTKLVIEQFESWLGASSRIVHIDFHSGLGRYGQYKLLLNESADAATAIWLKSQFNENYIEVLGAVDGTAYPVSGVFGEWCQQQAADRMYRFIGAEYGTYDVVRVLKALREENSAHRFEPQDSDRFVRAKQELLECFCPLDNQWRANVVKSGLDLIHRASSPW